MPGWNDIFLYNPQQPLLFTQYYFWVFYLSVFVVFSIIYRKKSLRNAYLFLISLFFYYKSGGYFFTLLLLSTIIDYTVGHLIYRSKRLAVKRLWLMVSLIVNLGVLAYFKYSYFFIETFNQIFNTHLEVVNMLALWTNQATGSHFDISQIILPVGISFFTFQTISYTVDVFRNKVKPVNNILDFGFYVSFFPQLVAGPIVRAANFIPQLYQDFKLTKREMGHAVYLILNGLIKKMVISDYISLNFVDRIFDNPAAFTGFENLMAMYGYSIQIYCDFSGYTDIAIGVALLMGFRLPINFNSPYKAMNLVDFWRRWHISLSSWLRDYLYIPLGGNRKGRVRTQANLLVTMLLGGLWHGANLRFMIWGGMHGLGLVFMRMLQGITGSQTRKGPWMRFFSIFLTFHFVTFLWIFFRAEGLDEGWIMVQRIFEQPGISSIPAILRTYFPVLLLMGAAYLVHWLPTRFKEWYRGWFINLQLVWQVLLVMLFILIIVQVKTSALQPFIYFQF